MLRKACSVLIPRMVSHSSKFSQCSILQNVSRRYSVKASKVSLLPGARSLEVTWKDGTSEEFPFVWLRDSCQCSSCYHPTSRSRTINLMDFNLNSRPVEATLNEDSVTLIWDDNHTSRFSLTWLQSRSFNGDRQRRWSDLNQPPHVYWDSSLLAKLPKVEFEALLNDDNTLLKWLLDLDVLGVSLVENVPNQLGQVRKVAERVAFIKRTHYGEEFSVQAKADPSNVAYTGAHLQLHTDLPYYEYKPGVNILHCLIQYKGQGGESQISDGFNIANILRQQDPAAYELLTNLEVDWSDVGVENGNPFHKVHRGPVICAHQNGRYQRINFSQPQRDSHLPVPLEKVEPWYRALKKYCQLAHDPQNMAQFKLKPGQMLTFNNLRVLHGRTAFGQDFGGERHVQGAYIDWDEIRSRMRVLQSKLFD